MSATESSALQIVDFWAMGDKGRGVPWRPTSRFWPTIAPFYRAGARTAVSGHGPTAESVDPRSWSASGPSAAPEPHALPILPQPLVSATQRLCVKATLALIVSMVCTLAAAQTTSRLIVKLRDSPVLRRRRRRRHGSSASRPRPLPPAWRSRTQREMAIGAHVMALERPLDLAEAACNRCASLPKSGRRIRPARRSPPPGPNDQ